MSAPAQAAGPPPEDATAGEVTADVERCLAAIEARDPSLASFIAVDGDGARRAAAAIDVARRRRQSMPPLAGRILSVKDNIDTAGLATTRGSEFWRYRVPDADAEVVRRLRAAGAIVIGKANLHEVAFGATSQNPAFGNCRNAWDVARIPGGSSGGSAAGVAAGFCEASLGSDTGGSIRIPAALNGLVGLRPTVGRVSNHGVFPTSAQFDTVGPIAHRVTDVAAIYDVIAGHDAADPYSVDRPVDSAVAQVAVGAGRLRVGAPSDFFFDGLDPEVERLVRTALDDLGGFSERCDPISVPGAARAEAAMQRLVLADAANLHRGRLCQSPGRFGVDVAERLSMGLAVTEAEYAGAMAERRRWCAVVQRLFEQVDVLATPTVSVPAPLGGIAMVKQTLALTRLTAPWSLAGLPALTVPCGFTQDGLPVGLQLVGPAWSEAMLLAVGAAYQGATNHHLRRATDHQSLQTRQAIRT